MSDAATTQAEPVVDLQPTYKPLPVGPEIEEVPVPNVDVPSDYETPAQAAAWSEADVVETPVPIIAEEMPPEPDAESLPYDPEPHFKTIDVAAIAGAVLTFVQVTPKLPYRRLVTVLSTGDAAQVLFNFRGGHIGANMLQVSQGDLPLDIPVFPGQELWVTHATAVVQQMSFIIEPRGKGR